MAPTRITAGNEPKNGCDTGNIWLRRIGIGYIGAVGGSLPHGVTGWEVTMLEILAVIMAAIIIILAVVYWGLVRWNRN